MSARKDPPAPRRLEVPVLADIRGNVWAAGVLDASLRHQGRRVLAESPPPGVSPELVRAVLGSGAELARARGDAGAVTVAFAADPATGEIRLLESIPGLPAEHAVLESLTGVDLPAWQARLARGGSLDSDLPEPRGHAFQVCLSARDPEDGFAPAPGVLEALRLPSGAGLRADPALEEGEVPDTGDPAIVRLTAHGRSRTEALLRLQQGLAKTVAVVRGGGTDKAFLTELLDQSEIDRGAADPAWLDRLIASGAHLSRRGADAALLAAAVTVYEREADAARIRYYASAMRGRPDVAPDTPLDVGASVELWYRGQGYALRVACLEPGLFRVDVDGSCFEIKAGPPARTGRRLACGGRGWHVSVVPQGDDFLIEVDGVPHRISGDPGSIVRAPAPAVVVAVPVQERDEVQAGDPLVVLEAMKMETTVPAPATGRVRKVLVRRNSQVGAGAPMLVLDPPSFGDIGARPQAGQRVRFEPLLRPKARASSSCRESLLEVRRLVLGYDVESDAAQRAAAAAATVADTDEAGVDRLIQEILRTYVDLGSLFRRQAEDSVRHSSEEFLFTFLRDLDARGEALPPAFLARLRRALEHYGVTSLDRSPELEESLYRIGISHRGQPRQAAPILALLERLLESAASAGSSRGEELRDVLDRLIEESQGREPSVHDLAREVRYRLFDRSILLAVRDRLLAAAEADLAALAGPLPAEERAARIRAVVDCPQPLHAILSERFAAASPTLRAAILEILVLRYYSRVRNIHDLIVQEDGLPWLRVDYEHPRADVRLLGFHAGGLGPVSVAEALGAAARQARATPRDGRELALDLYLYRAGNLLGEADEEAMAAEIAAALARPDFPQDLRRIAVCFARPEGVRCFTFRQGPDGGYEEDGLTRGLHPMVAQRFELWRLTEFRLHRLPAPEGVLLFHGTAHENPKDERLFALSEVRDLTPVRDASGRIVELPQLERMLMEALAGIRRFQSRRAPNERLHWNRVLLYLWPPVDLRPDEISGLVQRLTPRTEGLGLEKVALRCRIPDRETGNLRDWVLEISNPGTGMVLRFRRPSEAPLKPLREFAQKVIELRKRGLFHPFDIIRMLTPPRQSHPDTQGDLPAGDFAEHDLDADGRLVPVDRPPGANTANLVAGVIRSYTGRYPEGMARVILLGDAGRGMGTLAEPECRLILGALDLAERMQVPLEWFALSAGARISMDSGTENMDWIGLVLRRLVEYTQRGGEVNLVVPGINVGAQPYWNAEATMLMHTRGILVMTPEGAMVLTGKQALDYSGGVSAEDNQGIGGYERIMGPNGQAQYFAHDLPEACRILLRWYEHTWKAPGERFPRPAPTSDPRDRDVRDFPHGGPHGGNFRTVGEVLSEETNPGRKKPFDIRKVMGAVIDQDHAPAERWYGMRDAEIGVVWDAHLGGHPVCLLGFESRPLPRLGFVPAYGPDHWTGGTLFPLSAKKIARAINSASGNRPLVVLANLSGFDGSPESMRQWQLEYGAEIGRAVVNFKGPIVFCVVSRYHGGAFVVFSNALNDNMEVAALEGSHASVIGGAPAAAVVFAREVDRRTRRDPRIAELEQEILDSTRTDKAALRARLGELLDVVKSEKLGDLAEEFDHIHSVQRAQQVGSIHHILPPVRLRPYLIEAVERGMERAQ